jgi:gliding motility-associated-like protein
MKRVFLLIIVLIASYKSNSQSASACNAAQPICANPSFTFSNNSSATAFPTALSVSNPGTNPQGVNSGCLLSNGPGPQWLVITVSSNGTLGFSFGAAGSPNPQAGFYDWAMWPYSPTACADIFANTLPPVSCNWNASSTGGTGMGPVPAGGNAGNFQPSLNVTAGQQFIICVSNFSSVNSTVTFSNTGSAALSCNSFVVASQTICAGGSAVLSGTTNLTNASYTLTPGGNVSPTLNFNVSPLVNTTYTINVSGTDPNLLTAATLSTTAVITVISPTVSINAPITICSGGTANFTSNATGASAYSWTGPNAFTSALQNPSLAGALPAESGVYTVSATVTTGTLNCAATNTTNLTVVPINPVVVSPSVVTICQGGAIPLNATAVGASSYTWSGPAYGSPFQTNVITNAIPAMTGIYNVTASFTAGTLTCTSNNSVNVTVNPQVNFTLTPQPNLCDGQTFNVAGPAGATSYTWTGPNGFTANTQNLSIPNVNTTHSGYYALFIDVNGCATRDSIEVSVLTPMSFTPAPASRSICKGDTIPLSVYASGGSGVYNFMWSPPTGLLFSTGPKTIGMPTVSTQYSIVLNDVACPTATMSTSFLITVNPLPQPNITPDITEGCVPLCVNFYTNPAPFATSLLWNFGGHFNASGDTIRYCFKKPGVYPIHTTVTDINGCKSSNTELYNIKVYPRPEPNFIWEPGEVTLIDNLAQFTSYFVNGPITYYHWDFGDVHNLTYDTSSFKSPRHEFTQVGIYPVTLIETNIHGCTDTITKNVYVLEDFTMYIPNTFTPNGDGINDIFLPKGMGFKPDQYEITIYDRWGHMVFHNKDVNTGWDGTIRGAIAPNDVYIYKIRCITASVASRKEYTGHVTLAK